MTEFVKAIKKIQKYKKNLELNVDRFSYETYRTQSQINEKVFI